MSTVSTEPVVLAEPAWQAMRTAHETRVRRWTEPHHRRRARGEKHPVLDFLFSYYSQRPARLARWSPGLGVVLAGRGARTFLDRPGFVETTEGVTIDPGTVPASRLETAEFIGGLLAATARRSPQLGCFGLHEWAMAYRAGQEQLRHGDWPLRLGPAGTDAVLESQTVRCGHFDAFRFFTPAAVSHNTLTPTRQTQPDLEQPGCLHANMDLSSRGRPTELEGRHDREAKLVRPHLVHRDHLLRHRLGVRRLGPGHADRIAVRRYRRLRMGHERRSTMSTDTRVYVDMLADSKR